MHQPRGNGNNNPQDIFHNQAGLAGPGIVANHGLAFNRALFEKDVESLGRLLIFYLKSNKLQIPPQVIDELQRSNLIASD